MLPLRQEDLSKHNEAPSGRSPKQSLCTLLQNKTHVPTVCTNQCWAGIWFCYYPLVPNFFFLNLKIRKPLFPKKILGKNPNQRTIWFWLSKEPQRTWWLYRWLLDFFQAMSLSHKNSPLEPPGSVVCSWFWYPPDTGNN